MVKYKNVWIAVVVGMICALIISFGAIYRYTENYNNKKQTFAMGDGNGKYDVSLELTKSWSENAHGFYYGAQYDGTIYNFTDSDVDNWAVEVTLAEGSEIDSLWEGIYTLSGNILTITSKDYNQTIFSNDNRTFGFVVHTNAIDCIQDVEVYFTSAIKMTDLLVFKIWAILALIFIVATVVSLIFIERTVRLEKQKDEYLDIINQSFLTFSNMIDAKDIDTKGHSQRVAVYSRELSKKLGYDANEQQRIFYIGLLHDIGKIGTADALLKKNGRLTADEYDEVSAHVLIGGDIIKDFSAIDGIEAGVRFHHERWDGSGYAEGLKGVEIPMYARIIGIADAFDAMTSDRVYRKALSVEEAREELLRCAGTQFDPAIVPKFVELIDEGVFPVEISTETVYHELKVRRFGSYI